MNRGVNKLSEKKLFKVIDGWNLEINNFDKEQLVHYGSNLLCGNGYLAYRGTLEEWDKEQYKACIVSDTYDMADGKWRELTNAPDGLLTQIYIDDRKIGHYPGSKYSETQLGFDYRYGIFKRKSEIEKNNFNISIESERFASYDNLHLIANKYQINNLDLVDRFELKIGIDGDVWNLNGEHLNNFVGEYDSEKQILYLKAETVEKKIDIVTALAFKLDNAEISNIKIENKEKSIFLILEIDVEGINQVEMQRNLSIYSSNDLEDPLAAAVSNAEKSIKKSYNDLLDEHQDIWNKKWELIDIKLKGNQMDQLALRFNLYHNIIATPAHSDKLPIGARGLSCQAYQGAAFWDQEIFNLPMFLFTETETAKNILKYRYHTLDGARKKAKDLGYDGAFYAWISGKSGEELCPSFFFKDVISGRKIRNHFNDWQIHVSPDISYAVWQYFLASDDIEFIINYGAEILFEVARFLHSRLHYNQYKDQYEIIRLLGPDEYHENVDNNAFTNYQSKYALKKALYFYFKLNNEFPDQLDKITKKINLSEDEITAWQEIAEKLYLPKPDPQSKLIEQFDGYFKLEDTTAEELEKRLINKDEYWGWPNGVAVFTQVIKQADVIQLFTLHNIFPQEVVEKNYNYYEPRTQHGSSLSPSQYAITAARIGNPEETYRYFEKSAYIDLKSTNKAVSGGTFIGGIHTAAAGGIWQLIVNGFAGMRLNKKSLSFDPVLTEEWEEIEWKITYKNQKLDCILNHNHFVIKSSPKNTKNLILKVFGKDYKLKVGEEIEVKI
jgi:kojibiose phosphorylase